MSRALLDINVLLALLDADHVDHDRAHDWLSRQITGGWASCAVTQNGFVRVISQPRYPSPIATAEAVGLLASACADEHHEFWACDVSLLDDAVVDTRHLLDPRQVTDIYLLALATKHGGRFVMFDRSIALSTVRGATRDNLVAL